MEVIASPAPTAPPADNRTHPSPDHQLHLRSPLPYPYPKHNLSLHHTSSQPLTPQTTPIPLRKKINTPQKKRKEATISHVLPLMDALHFPISIDIYTTLVKECTLSRDPKTAIDLHNHITSSVINPPLPLLNRILIMLVSCDLLENARHLFDKMPVRDFHSWAILFIAYYENTYYEEATCVFINMLNQFSMMEFPPWIWSCLLTACACIVNVPLGMQVHGCLLKLGICDNVLLSSSLISFYGRFKCLEDANIVFNRASQHNTLTWTAKIVNGCRERHFYEVLSDFKDMGKLGIRKDSFTFSSVLKACGKMLNHGRCGEQVHANAIKLGMVYDNYVQCSLIAMYGRSGLLGDAKLVFEMTRNERNVDCWNAMLMGYIQNGLYIEAVKFLYQMKEAGMQPHESLLEKLRIACGSFTISSTK